MSNTMPRALPANRPTPRVSVLTATYNGERYLDLAISSILDQTFSDFEYFLIDDASTDSTSSLVATWAACDPRIRLLHNEQSLRPAGALNCALAQARGDYIAILDHDDLAMPTRLAEQVAFLDTHPEIGVVGSQVQGIDEEGKETKINDFPTEKILSRWQCFFRGPAQHSAVMMRRSLVEEVGGYSPRMWTACDYELFARLLKVTEIVNLPTTLVAYRRSSSQLSSSEPKRQTGQVLLFLLALVLERLELRVTLQAIHALYDGVRVHQLETEAELAAAGELLGEMMVRFLARTPMSAAERVLVQQDVAWRYLVLARTHRHTFRTLSRKLFTQSIALDPEILQRSRTRRWLRKQNQSS